MVSLGTGRKFAFEPLAEALIQVSNLVGSQRGGSTDAFAESLQHLQALHDQQVSALSGEIARLREEAECLNKVDSLGKGAKPVDCAAGPCEEATVPTVPQPPLVIATREPPSSVLRRPWRKRRTKVPQLLVAAEAAEQGELPRGASQLSRADSKSGLSYEVSRNISRHLTQFRSERSPFPRAESFSRQETPCAVLLDEYGAYRRHSLQSDSSCVVRNIVSNPKFDLSMGAIIVMNAVTIGLEASLTRAGDELPFALHISEYVFLFLYLVELGLRLGALGRRAVCNSWVQFDALLVCCGVIDVAIGFRGPPSAILDNVMLVRIFRLARLARVLRLMIKFHTLWMLVHGLLNSLMTLIWTCIIICVLLFVFSVLGLELLQPDPSASDEYNRVASENFGTLLKASTSLLQGMTLDSFAVIYRPVILARPFTLFYFVPFLLVVSIALMNLVTALMVNFSLEQAMKDKKLEEEVQSQKQAEVIRILERAFGELDTNQSGRVDLQEMLAAPEELRTLICEVADVGEGEEDIAYIFRMLDFDNHGYLEIQDFCQRLLMLHDRKALESYFVIKVCSNILKMVTFRQKSDDQHKSSPITPEADPLHWNPCRWVDEKAHLDDVFEEVKPPLP